MALHIRDPEVDRLAAELAELRRSTKTEAVKQALQRELAREKEKLPLWERLQPLLADISARPDSGVVIDKSFYDALSGEDER